MESNTKAQTLRQGFAFCAHLTLLLLTWVAPFWFSWPLVLLAYGMVQLQFFVFGRCLMNKGHALSEENDATFYGYLLDKLGFQFNPRVLKIWVRRWIYVGLGIVAVWWQVVLGYAPVFF